MNSARSGDSNALTRQYMDSLLIEQRNLEGCVPDTCFDLFGRVFDTPVTTAALSHLRRPRRHLPSHYSNPTSQPRVYRLRLQRQHRKHRLMDPPQRLLAHESVD